MRIILLLYLFMVGFQTIAQLGTTVMEISADNASNYSTWVGNKGTGFSAWAFDQIGGNFYIGTTAQGANSFGVTSTASGYAVAQRSFESALKEGDVFTMKIGLTAMAAGGRISIDLLDGSTAVFSMIYSGGDTHWELDDGSLFGSITTPQAVLIDTSLVFSFQYNGGSNYTYTIASTTDSRDASNSIDGIDGIRILGYHQGNGSNFGFDSLRIESKYTIPNGTTLLVNSDVLVPYLEIRSGGALDVNEGNEIDCEGDLILNGNITLNASASAYSQLKADGIVSGSGSVTQEQYVASTGWHCMAMPVTGNLDEFGSVNTAIHSGTRNIFKWIESSTSWFDVAGASNGSATPNSGGSGYLVYAGTHGVIDSAGIIDVSGELFGSVTPSLTNSGTGDDAGWNLIGNPFPCGLNFFSLNTSDVESGYSIWDPNTGNYISYSGASPGNPRIPPMQAFWVKANGVSPSLGSISMSAHGDVENISSFLKNDDGPTDRIYLQSFEQANPMNRDELLIAFVAGSSDGADVQWDVSKRLNAQHVPSLMSAEAGSELAINAIDYGPLSATPKLLQLRFVSAKNNEDYFIALEDSLLTNEYRVTLEDKKLNKRHDLNSRAYRFTHDTTKEYRFVLHLEPFIEKLDKHTPVVVTVGSGIERFFIIYFKDGFSAEPVEGTLYDLQGKRVQSFTVPGWQDRVEVSCEALPTGIYLLKIQTQNGIHAEKILID